MNRRSFLQAIAGAVASLAGLPWRRPRECPVTASIDCKAAQITGERYWFDIAVPKKIDAVYSWSVKPDGRFDIAEHQRNTETVLWRR